MTQSNETADMDGKPESTQCVIAERVTGDVIDIPPGSLDDAVLQAQGHQSAIPRSFSWLGAIGLGYRLVLPSGPLPCSFDTKCWDERSKHHQLLDVLRELLWCHPPTRWCARLGYWPRCGRSRSMDSDPRSFRACIGISIVWGKSPSAVHVISTWHRRNH